ncbi:unnamed protein product [Macrosiphum euphorbiae]|uniref:Uncharacterized protein n=1 Tax=Macrosiphum euphorbiae TaxID=13131 RepID=A0AAV0XXK6_9HEMI|nr:unnamed protein product [Macrosiphum euphorbiae]
MLHIIINGRKIDNPELCEKNYNDVGVQETEVLEITNFSTNVTPLPNADCTKQTNNCGLNLIAPIEYVNIVFEKLKDEFDHEIIESKSNSKSQIKTRFLQCCGKMTWTLKWLLVATTVRLP